MANSENTMTHFGWEVSPFSAKTRWYLNHRGLPFKDIHPNFLQMRRYIQRPLGFMVMPVVHLSNGEVLQDSTVIINRLEADFPVDSLRPKTEPLLALIDSLLEIFGDEWMPIISMHTRWNTPGNSHFAVSEFAANAFPFLPGSIGRLLVGGMARRLAGYLPILGIQPKSAGEIDRLLDTLLDTLDTQLVDDPYLFGSKPCVGELAIGAQLYAHGWRDPYSRPRFHRHPNVVKWIQRLRSQDEFHPSREENPSGAVFLEKFRPLISHILDWGMPVWRTSMAATQSFLAAEPEAKKIPRGMGRMTIPIGRVSVERSAMSYHQWMLQFAIEAVAKLSPEERELWMRITNDDLSWVMEDYQPLIMRNYRLERRA